MVTTLTANGKDYVVSDLRYTFSVEVVAGTGESVPKIIAIMRDIQADTQKSLTAYSTSSVAVSSGTKTFELTSDVPYLAGTTVYMLRTSAPTVSKMFGTVLTSELSGGVRTITVSVSAGDVTGSGTYTDWTIRDAGPKGPTGAATFDIDALGSITAGDIADTSVFAASVGGTESKLTSVELKKYLGTGDYSNRFAILGDDIPDGTYPIDQFIPKAVKVTKIRAIAAAGTGSATLRNLTTPANMTHTAVSISTSGQEQSVTADNTVAEDKSFGVVISSASGLSDIQFAYETEPA